MEYGNFKRRDGGGFRDNRDNRDRDFRSRDSGDRGGDRFPRRERDDRFGGGGGGRGGFGGRERDDRFGGGRDPEESVFSKRVRAGRRRTYFFDVRKTRGEDYFITITESTRREEGFGYKRHKIFLYKEDFNRFVASLNEVVDHVKSNLMPEFDYEEFDRRQAEWEAQNRDADDSEGFSNEADDQDDDDVSDKFRRKDEDEMSW